ncbi:hypothetical protein [Streptomyces lavendulae]
MLAAFVVDVLHEAEASPQQFAVRLSTCQCRLKNRPHQYFEQDLPQVEPRVGCRRRSTLPQPVLLLDQAPGLWNALDQQSQDVVVGDRSAVCPRHALTVGHLSACHGGRHPALAMHMTGRTAQ